MINKEPAQTSHIPSTNEQHPSAWEAFTDDDTGDTYYYNHETGTSQWEVPESFDTNTQIAVSGAETMTYDQLLDAKETGY